VVNATRRMRHEDLAEAVLAAEGRRVLADSLQDLFGRRWWDEFGLIHCPCGRRLMDAPKDIAPEICPRCRAVAG
jgi:hypothetical protein